MLVVEKYDIVTHLLYPRQTFRVIEIKNGRITAELRPKTLTPKETFQVSDEVKGFKKQSE
ncbi:hypothetical protein D0962_23130 [Leptolyngbyaceae cyanobacterium CCMR0082]|uniref:Uncharacterized protein n=1 Tax=Adonisia turfae CCMR0082 TaxID=2304604 RepID=A0A6M0SAX8_9CYAN|nr:hypothetical protein [Adonisia turfae CCMR0082]